MRTSLRLILIGIVALAIGSTLRAADEPDPAVAAAGTFQIRNEKYGDLLRPKDANNANGTPIVLYPAQPWKCMTWKLHPAGESRFQLQNYFTSKTFAAKSGDDKNASVAQIPFATDADSRPTWVFSRLETGNYKITDAKTGKALTALKESNQASAHITVQEWRGDSNQRWVLIPIDPKDLTM